VSMWPPTVRKLGLSLALAFTASLTLCACACAREVVLRCAYPQRPSTYSLGVAAKGTVELAEVPPYEAEMTAALSYVLTLTEVSPQRDATLNLAASQYRLSVTLSGEALTPPKAQSFTLTIRLSPLGALLAPPEIRVQSEASGGAATQNESAAAAASPPAAEGTASGGSDQPAPPAGASQQPLSQLVFPAAALLKVFAFPSLPQGPVHEGSTWEGEEKLPIGNEEYLLFTYKAELKQFGAVQGLDAAYLTVEFTIPAPEEIPAWGSAASGEWQGRIDAILNVADGRVLQALTHSKLDLLLTPLPAEEPEAVPGGEAEAGTVTAENEEEQGGPLGSAGEFIAAAGAVAINLEVDSNLALLP